MRLSPFLGLHLGWLCGNLFFKDMTAINANSVLNRQFAASPTSPLYLVITVIIRVTVGDPA